ncbi:site-specific DNA-methyltransferase [Alysiella crassa]|uniref:site-specific DNA-methyltransferase n=1 Tax=Alysiella crassa TaxID=153491 RepID=UPI000A844664|nr:site-specific DNA-methyltransferase [Alysiella crassa]
MDALKSLLPFYAGSVKCIFIDPPYNTGSAFSHYDDNLEHSLWLNMMYPRLELLRELLAEDGSIWITLDDNESHYCKIMCDEIFGRNNFVANLIWEKKRKPSYLSKLGKVTDNILCYAKNKQYLNDLTYSETSGEETYPLYNAGNTRAELVFPPKSILFLKHQDGVYPPATYQKKTSTVHLLSDLIIENQWNKNEIRIEGEWRYSQKTLTEQLANGDYYVIKSLDFRPRRVFERESEKKKIHNLISRAHYDMATNEDASAEHLALFDEELAENPFDYPKPEKLIQFIITSSTNEGDLVLDSFLGSGTTAAVAHKMNRRYIGIEIGEHAKTHVVPRLQKVIDGEQGGISTSKEVFALENDDLQDLDLDIDDVKTFHYVLKTIGKETDLISKEILEKLKNATKTKKIKSESVWQGGGAFRFCELGVPVFDEYGSLNPEIKFADLAAYIWFLQTKTPFAFSGSLKPSTPLIGEHENTVYYLLYNGILGDKRPQFGNVLTAKILADLPHLADFVAQGKTLVVYGEACRVGDETLRQNRMVFKQIPYHVTDK